MYVQRDGGAIKIDAISFGHIGMGKSHSFIWYGNETGNASTILCILHS